MRKPAEPEGCKVPNPETGGCICRHDQADVLHRSSKISGEMWLHACIDKNAELMEYLSGRTVNNSGYEMSVNKLSNPNTWICTRLYPGREYWIGECVCRDGSIPTLVTANNLHRAVTWGRSEMFEGIYLCI